MIAIVSLTLILRSSREAASRRRVRRALNSSFETLLAAAPQDEGHGSERGMAGTDPRITSGDGQDGEGVISGLSAAEGKGIHQLGAGLRIPFPRRRSPGMTHDCVSRFAKGRGGIRAHRSRLFSAAPEGHWGTWQAPQKSGVASLPGSLG